MGVKAAKKPKSEPKDILVSKFPLHLKKEQRSLVDRIRKESARLWNDVLDLHWWLYDAYKVWTDASEKKKWFNGKTHNLHSQTIQAVVELHEETCKRTHDMRKAGNLNWKFPWKYKGFFVVIYKKSAISEKDGFLVLSNGYKEESLKIKKPKHIDSSSIKKAEIVWHNNGYWLHLALEHPKREKVVGEVIAGGDPGEIHAITLSDGVQQCIVTGRELRSVHRLRNKVLKKLSKKIAKKQKGSNKRKKLIERKRNFLAKMQRKIEYLEHAISRIAINWCIEHGVKKLFIGNPDGVQKHTKGKRSKKVNQKLSNWSFGELYRKLEYKGKLHGIEVVRIEESYTSGTCPSCGFFKKQSGRTFKCPNCEATGHRDSVGAVNIREKGIHGSFRTGRELPQFENTTYRRVRLHCKRAVAVAR